MKGCLISLRKLLHKPEDPNGSMVDESSGVRRNFALVGGVERFGDRGLSVEPVTSGRDVEVGDDLVTVEKKERRRSARVVSNWRKGNEKTYLEASGMNLENESETSIREVRSQSLWRRMIERAVSVGVLKGGGKRRDEGRTLCQSYARLPIFSYQSISTSPVTFFLA